MKNHKPRYYDIKIHVVDRPVDDEKYLTVSEIKKTIKLDLPAGLKVKSIRVIMT